MHHQALPSNAPDNVVMWRMGMVPIHYWVLLLTKRGIEIKILFSWKSKSTHVKILIHLFSQGIVIHFYLQSYFHVWNALSMHKQRFSRNKLLSCSEFTWWIIIGMEEILETYRIQNWSLFSRNNLLC